MEEFHSKSSKYHLAPQCKIKILSPAYLIKQYRKTSSLKSLAYGDAVSEYWMLVATPE